jgi:hypothetical protein
MKVDAFQNRNEPELSDFEAARKRWRAASGFFITERFTMAAPMTSWILLALAAVDRWDDSHAEEE